MTRTRKSKEGTQMERKGMEETNKLTEGKRKMIEGNQETETLGHVGRRGNTEARTRKSIL